MPIVIPDIAAPDTSADPWMTLAAAVRWAAWRDRPEPKWGAEEFGDSNWVSHGDLEERDRVVYASGAEKVRMALAAGHLEAWSQTGYDEPQLMPKARWSGLVLGSIVSWVEFYSPFDKIIVERAKVFSLWPAQSDYAPPLAASSPTNPERNARSGDGDSVAARFDDIEDFQVWPPDRAFVTLSEALSWIAFRNSVDCDALEVRLNRNDGTASGEHSQLENALADLLDKARSGAVSLVGKHIPAANPNIAATPTRAIPPIDLIDFAQFDIYADGLRCGNGLTWQHRNMALRRVDQVRRDRFHSVQVARAELLANFPPKPDIPPLPVSDAGHGPIHWDDFGPEALPALERLRKGAAQDEWWNWPEAIAWVGRRDDSNIAILRYWATEWSANGDADVTLGAQHYMAAQWCDATQTTEADLLRAIERGAIRTIGRASRDDHAIGLAKERWRGGAVVYFGGAAVLVSAKSRLTAWAFDIAIHRADLLAAFPAPPSDHEPSEPVAQKPARRRPGPAPDSDWPEVIASVTKACIAAGYKRPLKRGGKAAISTMLLSAMAEKDKHFSEDIAAKHATKVIEALPDH